MSKEAKEACHEAAKLFIAYLACTSNDFASNSNRASISSDDVIEAIKELEFDEFLPELQLTLEKFASFQKQKQNK